MYVNGTHLLVFCKLDVGLGGVLQSNRELQTGSAVSKLYTRGDYSRCIACVRGSISTSHALVVKSYGNACRTTLEAGENSRCCTCIVIVAEAIELAGRLSCDQLYREASVTELKVLVIVTCALLHLECKGNSVACAACEVACAGLTKRCKNLGKSAELRCIGKSVAAGNLNCRINVVHVDYVCELGNLTVCNEGHLVLKSKAANVCNLDMANLGVTGLPLVVVKDCTLGSIVPGST